MFRGECIIAAPTISIGWLLSADVAVLGVVDVKVDGGGECDQEMTQVCNARHP